MTNTVQLILSSFIVLLPAPQRLEIKNLRKYQGDFRTANDRLILSVVRKEYVKMKFTASCCL